MISLLILSIVSTMSRKPVYVVGGERCRWKFVDFQKTLRQKGLTRALTGAEDVSHCPILSWIYAQDVYKLQVCAYHDGL